MVTQPVRVNQLTWHSDRVKICVRDFEPIDSPLSNVVHSQFFGRMSRTVQRLDILGLRIVEETEGIS